MEFTKIHARYPEKKGFRLHRYTEDEFIFIHFLTSATVTMHGETLSAPAGSCIFFPPNTDYVLSSPHNDLIHDWFHANGDVDRLLDRYGLRFETLYSPSETQFITETVAAIETERHMKYPFAERLCALMGEELIARIARFSIHTDHAAIPPQLYRLLCEVRQRLHTAFAEEWTVEAMASSINLSPSYFHSLYKAAFGTSPKQELVNIRLRRAKSLLRYSNLSIGDIALGVGFSSSFHFSRSFKGAFGITPNQYRSSKKQILR